MSEIHVCGEIRYVTADGGVQSDICINGELTDETRNFLHDCLDEFLDHYDAPQALFSLGDFIV
ncbi:MAG TPA: hypothetical protein PKW49_00950 [Paludibacteraceae bacterium]|nr:hypothetical protein [Paludibacteraceae bacterium]